MFESIEANDDKESFVISNKKREETEAEYYVKNGEQKAKFYLRDQEAYFLKNENENLKKSYENKMIEMEDMFQKKLKEKDDELASLHKNMGEELRGLYYLLENMRVDGDNGVNALSLPDDPEAGGGHFGCCEKNKKEKEKGPCLSSLWTERPHPSKLSGWWTA